MAEKFTEIDRGAFQKLGKEYDYVVEVGEDFNGKTNMRVRVIEERPIITKVRTRYDPEIQLFGSKNASMNVSLGYNMKEIDWAIKWMKHVFLLPVYISGFILLFIILFKLPNGSIPKRGLFLLIPFIIMGIYYSGKGYLKMALNAMAEYFKAKDLKKLLVKEGYRK